MDFTARHTVPIILHKLRRAPESFVLPCLSLILPLWIFSFTWSSPCQAQIVEPASKLESPTSELPIRVPRVAHSSSAHFSDQSTRLESRNNRSNTRIDGKRSGILSELLDPSPEQRSQRSSEQTPYPSPDGIGGYSSNPARTTAGDRNNAHLEFDDTVRSANNTSGQATFATNRDIRQIRQPIDAMHEQHQTQVLQASHRARVLDSLGAQPIPAGTSNGEQYLADQPSFIEREESAPSKVEAPVQLMIRLATNLGFVLSIAVAVVLLFKHYQQHKDGKLSEPPKPEFQVRCSTKLPGGASIHLVELEEQRVLVATDASGIKSVQVLKPTFSETLLEEGTLPRTVSPSLAVPGDRPSDVQKDPTDLETKPHRPRAPHWETLANARTARQNSDRHEEPEKEDTQELDERLIRMLLAQN